MRYSQPGRRIFELSEPALLARTRNTACVTSSASCGSRTCRNAAKLVALTKVAKAVSDWRAAYNSADQVQVVIDHSPIDAG